MLGITQESRFWFLRNFHDMRCKYDRIRSIIHQQLDIEPDENDIFIIMSKDRRKVRMFHYDRRSCCMHEKRFNPGYQFMRIECDWEGKETYRISYDDVVLLLESPVVKNLKIR